MEKDALGQGIGLAGDLDLEAGAHRVMLFVVVVYICMHWVGGLLWWGRSRRSTVQL